MGEWAFDDGSGQQLTDYSGNGHHGQLGDTAGADTLDPAWGTNPARLVFDGDDAVATAENVTVIGSALHLDLIIRPSDATGDFQTVFMLATAATNKLTLFRNSDTPTMLYNWTATLTGTRSLFDDNWHHISMNFGSKNALPFVEARVDGEIDATKNEAGVSIDVGTTAVHIGDKLGDAFGMIGDFAYVMMNNIQFTDAQEAQNRKFLKNVMAARGVILP